MPPLVETTATQAQAVTHRPAEGEQPPREQATPVAQRDEPTREEKARALLKGEPPKDAAPDLSEEASIDAQFDPETDELLEAEIPESAEAEAESPADEAGSESPEDRGTPESEETEEDEEPEGGDRKARRIRVKRDALSDRDFAVLTLAKDKRITFAEAEQQLFGKVRDGAAEPPRAPQPQPTGEQTVEQIVHRINSARAQRDAASQQMDAARVNALNDELMELRDSLSEAKREASIRAHAAQQTAAQRYATAETTAINRATELYPEANTKGSRLLEAMQAKAASLRAEDPRFFENAKWPLLLAVETATELGIAAKVKSEMKSEVKGQAGKPAPNAAAIVVPKKTTRPAPPPAPGTATGAKTNTEAALREELKAATTNRDLEGIRAVMRKLTAAA